ncbi:hypothetical protein HW115_11705 [Verrucomicrobiaceae bacterium N1E253]|uniref:Uncharacterized protein n=1 Tax=Oceaniferula marina TaxID=2748318 RepID=A0A851GEU7_9BACT|nr:hypothetical protein [Oceaniferula marina]NWK56278.1 hypothetical protein [Oceaniferula marina]
MKTLCVFCLGLLVWMPSKLLAGGSVSYQDQVAPLLVQQPTLKKLIEKSFKLPDSGFATRLGNHFKNLGGLRIAPYSFVVESKDGKAKYNLTIHCETKFKLSNGELVSRDSGKIFEAVKVVEKVTHFTVAPLDEEKNEQ